MHIINLRKFDWSLNYSTYYIYSFIIILLLHTYLFTYLL